MNLIKIIEKGEKKKHEIAKDFVIPARKNKDVILKIFNIKLFINKLNLKLYLNSATWKKNETIGEYCDTYRILFIKMGSTCLDKKMRM